MTTPLPAATDYTAAANQAAKKTFMTSVRTFLADLLGDDGTAATALATLGAGDASKAGIQAQTYTAFTTGGTSTAFTLTPTPALSALATGQEFDVIFNAAAGATPTLAISGLTAKSLKYRDTTGAKAAVTSTQIPSGWRSRVVYDGTDYIVREVPPVTSSAVPVRQTVLSGPVDSSGYAAFVGATGATTVTATGTLKATAAAGGDANYTGSITNPSWTGLSTNGTMYLYLDITAAGVVTTGSTTLAPVYQWGGTYSTTNGQNTFNIQEMTMKAGNGSTAAQVYRVFVGEVTVAGGVVTAITWYALMGRYQGAWTSTLPAGSTAFSGNHNLGTIEFNGRLQLKNLTTENGYSVGDIVEYAGAGFSGVSISSAALIRKQRLAISSATSNAANPWYMGVAGGGAPAGLTLANWAYRFVAYRDF